MSARPKAPRVARRRARTLGVVHRLRGLSGDSAAMMVGPVGFLWVPSRGVAFQRMSCPDAGRGNSSRGPILLRSQGTGGHLPQVTTSCPRHIRISGGILRSKKRSMDPRVMRPEVLYQ
jgi:hypothetical protein